MLQLLTLQLHVVVMFTARSNVVISRIGLVVARAGARMYTGFATTTTISRLHTKLPLHNITSAAMSSMTMRTRAASRPTAPPLDLSDEDYELDTTDDDSDEDVKPGRGELSDTAKMLGKKALRTPRHEVLNLRQLYGEWGEGLQDAIWHGRARTHVAVGTGSNAMEMVSRLVPRLCLDLNRDGCLLLSLRCTSTLTAEMLSDGHVNLDPVYQRDIVWSVSRQESLIQSLFFVSAFSSVAAAAADDRTTTSHRSSSPWNGTSRTKKSASASTASSAAAPS